MQPRRLRLGDILDDYCPRERRVTNHAVVAIVGDDVKQTRCTTCDIDHEYRQGKAPAARRSKAGGALAGEHPDETRPVLTRVAAVSPDAPHDEAVHDVAEPEFDAPPQVAPAQAEPPMVAAAPADQSSAAPVTEPVAADDGEPRDDDGPVHRRLIRATFPRPEGHVPERREPEFTVRQQGSRGRGGDVNGNSPGYRGRGNQPGFGGGQGGGRNFGGRQSGSGFGYDQRNSGRGPGGGRGGDRQGQGGGGNRGPRQGGAGRKGGR